MVLVFIDVMVWNIVMGVVLSVLVCWVRVVCFLVMGV